MKRYLQIIGVMISTGAFALLGAALGGLTFMPEQITITNKTK